MGKIIAIGGGSINRPGIKSETLGIDREIIRLTGKKTPKLLFIPTASNDAYEYVKSVKCYFGKKLGCKVDSLLLFKKKYFQDELRKKIINSDIVYVGGGNTLKMMRAWRKFGIDLLLKRAYKKGVVLSGLSAGSICWFRYGNSDSARFGKNKQVDMIRVKGIGILPALHCPHYNIEKHRSLSLKKMMKNFSGVAIAIDNCAAIEIVDNSYRILKTKKSAKTYKVYWKKGRYFREELPTQKVMLPVSNLFIK